MNVRRFCECGDKVASRHILLLAVLSSIAGCTTSEAEYPPTVAAEGRVIYKGEPVEGAAVMFQRVDGTRGAVALTDEDGYFTLTTYVPGDGAHEGDYRVEIAKYAEPDMNAPEGTTPPLHSLLPIKYTKAETSSLTAQVTAGENSFTFDLAD